VTVRRVVIASAKFEYVTMLDGDSAGVSAWPRLPGG
jgi:hypothetical protein